MTEENKITPDSVVSQAEELVFADIDGEVVLMTVENGDYFGFDLILSKIWDIIEAPTAIPNLVDQLMQEYDVDHETCESDVLDVLNKLHAEQLIRLQ
jgi:hypothetical protein